jgi:hypothetical protein
MAMGFLRKHLSIVTALGICVVASSALPGGAAIVVLVDGDAWGQIQNW